jgi:hypothetical protein
LCGARLRSEPNLIVCFQQKPKQIPPGGGAASAPPSDETDIDYQPTPTRILLKTSINRQLVSRRANLLQATHRCNRMQHEIEKNAAWLHPRIPIARRSHENVTLGEIRAGPVTRLESVQIAANPRNFAQITAM